MSGRLRLAARSLLFVASLAASSCASTKPTWTASRITIAMPEASSPPSPKTPTYVVWTTKDGGPVSRLVAAGPGGIEELGEVSFAIVVWDERAHRFDVDASEVELVACDDGSGSAPAPLAEKGKHEAPVLEELGTHDRAALDAPTPPGGLDDYQDGASIEASLGPYVFVTTSTYVFACGAHGNASSESFVWDLRSHRRATLVAEAEVPREREAARRALETPDRGWDDPLALEDVSLVEAVPSFTGGRVGLELHFVAPACYACSDGQWSSYTASTRVDTPLPASLAPFSRPTPWMASYLRRHEGERLGGVTEVDVARVPGLAEAFGRKGS